MTRDFIIQAFASLFIGAYMGFVTALAIHFYLLDKPQAQPKEEYNVIEDAERYLQKVSAL